MRALVVLLALVPSLLAVLPPAPAALAAEEGLLPDLRTVVPQHLQLVHKAGRETLRFSNGIANTGAGDWRMRAELPLADTTEPQLAIQELLRADGTVASESVVSVFEWHPSHKHWHIGDVARFEARVALDDGTGGAWGDVVANDRGAAQSFKTTFCLIDLIKLDGNSPSTERRYWDCFGEHQGIQAGWVDQYHHATVGQQLDITSAPAGLYYLVSIANPDGTFIETDASNNGAWTSFRLARPASGNPSIDVVARSACEGGLCGASANR